MGFFLICGAIAHARLINFSSTNKSDTIAEEIRAKFAVIEDLRHPGYVEHKLVDVLMLVLCAVLCGLDSLGNMMIFAENNQEFLREKLGIEKIPSKATLARILSMVDGTQVGEIMIALMRERFGTGLTRTEHMFFEMIALMRERFGTAGNVVAVDGKAIRSAARAGNPHSALQILTAYVTSSGVILGQQAIHEKTNEIPTFQQMLEVLDIKGKTVTTDAMHCQRETCRKIVSKGGDYLFGLKDNQPSLLEDARLFLEDAINGDSTESHTTI